MEWFNVKEKLPIEGENVLCWNKGSEKAVMARYERGEFYVEKYPDMFDRCVASYWGNVMYWQPLPKAPK